MTEKGKSKKELLLEIEELRLQLAEAEDTIRAIREGEVDAVLSASPDGDRIYTLHGAEHPYRVFFEAMNEGAVTTTFDGTILYCNHRFADLAKVPLEKAMGMSLLDFVPEGSRQAVAALLSEAGLESHAIESSLIVQGGNIVPVNISVNLLRTKDLEAVCAIVTDLSELMLMRRLEEANERLSRTNEKLQTSERMLRDSRRAALNLLEDTATARKKSDEANAGLQIEVTERKRAEYQLIRKSEELAAINKELEAYSYTISHDLRAPLRSIEGFSNAIIEDYADKLDATGMDYFLRVTSASRRMSQLIDALLTMSRLTQSEIKEKVVNLSDVVNVIAHELKRSQPERAVEFVIAERVSANGDQVMLRIVLENLLNNAWKFTSRHPTGKIEFGATRIDDKDVYFVRDDGAGFNMEFADKLFSPFKRFHTETEFPGLGIGLATIHKIITKHGGKIWAESAPEKGTTFYFTLG